MRAAVTDGQLSLRLVGYYRCAGHGFAMPLFGQSEGANTLYIAIPATAGDHCGPIRSFEPVDVDDQRRLPHGESIAIDVGNSWRDVFLWNDVAYVGTPEELWNELTPFHSDVEARAPLSLLDLAIHAGRGEVALLAPTAFGFVRQKFGEARARGWRRQLIRQLIETAIRHALIDEQHAPEAFNDVIIVERSPGVLSLDLPGALAGAVAEDESFQRAFARIAELSKLLGADVRAWPKRS